MARSKRGRKLTRPKDDQREQVYEEPDPDADDYFHDDVDKFHAEREKIMLDSTVGEELSGDENELLQDEEVMALSIEESDDEEVSKDGNDSVNEQHVDEEFDEEFDDEEEDSESEKDNEKGIPSQKSWGRKKSAFYDADIVEEFTGSDEEMDKLAEAEEEEALALQKQMAASFEEQDFDADIFEIPQTTQTKGKEDDLSKERIVQDLSKLSKAEKIQILMKDSPELFQLMNEFKSKLKEVIEELHPLVKMARAGRIPKEGANYLELKHQLYLNYCINIGFYLVLKAKKMPVRDHPVMERLVQYQKLIIELKPLDEKLKSEVKILLSQTPISQQNGLQEQCSSNSVQKKNTSKNPPKKPVKLSSLLDDDEDEDEFTTRINDRVNGAAEKEEKSNEHKKGKKGKRKKKDSEPDAMDPLEYYETVKLQKKRKKEAKLAALGFAEEQEEAVEEDNGDGKRGITYEISQNKGLTAKKKKELRNPRVKHRKKFYKAQIKRKSQVLPVVNEQNRYGGEMTGIRSNLTRSIKIK